MHHPGGSFLAQVGWDETEIGLLLQEHLEEAKALNQQRVLEDNLKPFVCCAIFEIGMIQV